MKNIESAKLNKNGQISIPGAIRKFLKLVPGDNVGFEVQEDGNVVLKPIVVIDRRRAWFYTPEIEKSIREAEQEIQQGKSKTFDTATELIRWLKK